MAPNSFGFCLLLSLLFLSTAAAHVPPPAPQAYKPPAPAKQKVPPPPPKSYTPPPKAPAPPVKPYTPPPKSQAPPVKPYTPPPKSQAPPVKAYTPPPKAPAPPVGKSPGGSYPPKGKAPAPVVKPPTPTTPYYGQRPPVKKQECVPLCKRRCGLHSRMGLCMRACSTCCYRCKCVPPGTYGNKEVCGRCYTDMTTHGGRPKCP